MDRQFHVKGSMVAFRHIGTCLMPISSRKVRDKSSCPTTAGSGVWPRILNFHFPDEDVVWSTIGLVHPTEGVRCRPESTQEAQKNETGMKGPG